MFILGSASIILGDNLGVTRYLEGYPGGDSFRHSKTGNSSRLRGSKELFAQITLILPHSVLAYSIKENNLWEKLGCSKTLNPIPPEEGYLINGNTSFA